MSFCPCGSQKKTGAPETVNPNDIGVLCFLFGLEGTLCRLLDLIPNVIRAYSQLDPDNLGIDNEKIINKLLKKVVGRIGEIAIDDFTGNINLASFCALEPPPPADDITYADIYEFCADVIPILSRFFKFNSVLVGDSTKLLDKIVAIWLRQQWFIHCECQQCTNTSTPIPTKDSEPLTCKNGGLPSTPAMNSVEERIVYKSGTVTDYVNGQIVQVLDIDPTGYNVGYNPTFLSITGGTFRSFSKNDINWLYVLPTDNATYRPTASLIVWEDGKNQRTTIRESGGRTTRIYWELQTIFNGRRIQSLPESGEYNKPECIEPPPPPVFPKPFCDLYPDDVVCRISGCTNPLATNYNPDANYDDGSCILPIYGCTDPTAINFNPLATISDNSCEYLPPPVFGCTDSSANNYDPLATNDDGSCLYGLNGCTNPLADNYDPEATNDDGSCILPVYGCTNPLANNYNPFAGIDDDSCTFDEEISGCTDPLANNYNPLATIENGSCNYDPPVLGCTNPIAINFNPLANKDDGSCIIDNKKGCTNPKATNYDPTAKVNDGSCLYCETIGVDVTEFNGCQVMRSLKNVELISKGKTITIQVVEWVSCNTARTVKTVQLNQC